MSVFCLKKEIIYKETFKDNEGRVVSTVIQDSGEELFLCNIYAPNKDRPDFFCELIKNTTEETVNKVFIGNYNVVTNIDLDRKGEKCNNKNAAKILVEIKNECNLTDVWRDRNISVKRYSYFHSKPKMASQIDYALISRGLDNQIDSAMYIPAPFTDHSGYFLSVNFSNHDRGRGYWKFNDSHLNKADYVHAMNEHLERKINIEFRDLSSQKEKWELIKFVCATFHKNGLEIMPQIKS